MTGTSGIRWRPWSAAAFDEAKKSDKPILLRLSAVWCHWCHVMDGTSDKEPRAIELLNERFVPIRVDIDKMPDVRERYNFGGYPTSAFLTPDGDILTGGTYIPPEQFVSLLEAVATQYKSRKDEILGQIAAHREHHGKKAPAPPEGSVEKFANDLYDDTLASLLGLFDATYGGFGSQPKFPHGAATVLAIRAHQVTGEKEYRTVAQRGLDAMRVSALWDREEKAFFRYSVKGDWSEPHYEKMLETNAALLSAYATGYGAWGREEDLSTIRQTREYLDAVLRDPKTGLFYGSQDADEEYYAMELAERKTRKAPFVDRTHYADWTSQMVSAFCDAYRATGDAAWLDDARRTFENLMRLAFRPNEGFLHFIRDGKAERTGILSDQAYGARAALDLFELTGDEKNLHTAEAAAKIARASMWDAKRLVYNDKTTAADDLGLLSQPHSSPVENGVMAQVLERLAFHLPDGPYRRQLDELLRGHAGAGERSSIFASELALAALSLVHRPLEVHVTGPARSVASAVREAAKIEGAPTRVLRSDGPWPTAGEKLGRSPPSPSVFFCGPTACSRVYKTDEPFAADAKRIATGR